jgi:hypothetical protein
MTFEELYRNVVNAGGLALLQAPDLSISPRSFDNVATVDRNGTLHARSGRQWPHIVIRARGGAYTSIALAFEKPHG